LITGLLYLLAAWLTRSAVATENTGTAAA